MKRPTLTEKMRSGSSWDIFPTSITYVGKDRSRMNVWFIEWCPAIPRESWAVPRPVLLLAHRMTVISWKSCSELNRTWPQAAYYVFLYLIHWMMVLVLVEAEWFLQCHICKFDIRLVLQCNSSQKSLKEVWVQYSKCDACLHTWSDCDCVAIVEWILAGRSRTSSCIWAN
jgi:hypothetical protein